MLLFFISLLLSQSCFFFSLFHYQCMYLQYLVGLWWSDSRISIHSLKYTNKHVRMMKSFEANILKTILVAFFFLAIQNKNKNDYFVICVLWQLVFFFLFWIFFFCSAFDSLQLNIWLFAYFFFINSKWLFVWLYSE